MIQVYETDQYIGGISYGAWVRKWLDWSLRKPATTSASNHPLKDFASSSAPRPFNRQIEMMDDQIVALGGYWEDDVDQAHGFPTSQLVVRRLNNFPADKPVLICAVCSVISVEEHPDQFPNLKGNVNVLDINAKAASVINKTDSKMTITPPNGQAEVLTPTQGVNRLKRMWVHAEEDLAKRPRISRGIWHFEEDDKPLKAAMDGYWAFLHPLQHPGTYRIDIESNSPLFDPLNPHINRNRGSIGGIVTQNEFKVRMRYFLTV